MKIHIVQKGDTIWDIAKKYGVDFEEVKNLNPQISSPDMIMPGMKIKIPSTTKQVKKDSVAKEKQQKKPMKEQQVPAKPIEMIPEDDHKKPKEMKIEKPKHPSKEMPKLPDYPHMHMPEMPMVPVYPKKEMPKKPEAPKKEKPKTEEKIPMPEYPSMEIPLGTPHMPEFPKMPMPEKPCEEKVECLPIYPMPMMPCCCHMIQPSPCCHHMNHHFAPVGGVNIEHMHPGHHMNYHPQDISQHQAAMPGYPMSMGPSNEYQHGSMYPQQNWQPHHMPSYRDVSDEQQVSSKTIKNEKESKEQIYESPSDFREQVNYSYPTPPMYPDFLNENDDFDNES